MDKRPQLTDRSDHLPLSPKDELRQFIKSIAVAEGGDTSQVVNQGIRWLSPETHPDTYLVAQIIDLPILPEENRNGVLPEQVLTLEVYDDKTGKIVEDITISGGADDVVATNKYELDELP